jgi:hypothetical protein
MGDLEAEYKEPYEILSAALAFHMAFALADQDGKIDLTDVQYLITPLIKLPSAISGADQALTQLKSMSAAARAEMLSRLASEYDIADDVLEAKIEAGVEWLLSTGKFVGTLV